MALATWDLEEPVPISHYAALQTEPGYAEAVRRLAGNMLALSDSDKAVDGLFKDAGRYLAALCAASMRAEGVTLPKLKELCAAFGLLSAGRARALLIYLRYLGYVDLWSERSGSGPARYRIAPAFLLAWRAQLRAALAAASVIEPEAAAVAALLDVPAFFDIFCQAQLEGLIASMATTNSAQPFFQAFANHHAGTQILFTLLVQCDGSDFPSREPMRFPVSELARRFHVSQMHVKRILLGAERAGWLTRLADGQILLTNVGCEEINFLYSAQLVRLLVAAALAARRYRG